MNFPELLSLLWLEVSPLALVRDSKSYAEDKRVGWKGRLQRLHRRKTFIYYNSSKVVISVQGKNHFW